MIAGMVLAAGESRRMGEQKVLLPYGESTILGHILAQISCSAIQETVVVTGHQPQRVQAMLSGRKARAVHNAQYEEGMLSSVRTGLRALPGYTQGVMLFLGDQPEVSPAVIAGLIDRFQAGRGDLIVPVFDGRRGHPLLFDIVYRAEILTGLDDTGLRGLFHRYPERIVEVPCSEEGVLHDLDTPGDYAAALARARSAGDESIR